MTLEIFAIGGYEEVGKNMSVVKYNNQLVILDMGIALDKLLLWEENNFGTLQENELLKISVLPDDSILNHLRTNVSAIVASHAHLDHIGAIGKLAAKYKCPVIGTPFTLELLKENLKEEKSKPTHLITLNTGEVLELGELSIEFIHVTHSVPQTTFTAVHTPEGIVFYANDYKFDNYQALQKPPDYHRIKKLGKEGVRAVIVESVRVDEAKKTPSEVVARELLKDTLTETFNESNGIIVTCFSSHIERLNSILQISKELDRNVVFAGRSLAKYVKVAEKIGIRKFSEVEILGKQKTIQKRFEEISRKKQDYLLVVTGGQGEPTSILSRIANSEYKYKVSPGDEIIFSCNVIPNPSNIENRHKLESKLKFRGARIFSDVHVSGHAAREDHHDLLKMLEPENIIPCHGDIHKLAAFSDLAFELNKEIGSEKYSLGETVHILRDGQKLRI